MPPLSLVLAVALLLLHAAFCFFVRASLRSDTRARDEIFVHGSNQLFGPPRYMRARFLLPWVVPHSLANHAPRTRLLFLAARLSGAGFIAGFIATAAGFGLGHGA